MNGDATCGNRTPITGECMIGCGGFGSCRQGKERPLPPWPEGYNPLTGEFRAPARTALAQAKKEQP